MLDEKFNSFNFGIYPPHPVKTTGYHDIYLYCPPPPNLNKFFIHQLFLVAKATQSGKKIIQKPKLCFSSLIYP